MVSIVGIQLQKNGKIYYFDINGLKVRPGDYVVADTARGADLGEVVVGAHEVEDQSAPASLKKIIRIATPQDIQRSSDNRQKEKEAYKICQKKIAEHQLDMKLVSVEYAFDGSKIQFYFTANGRVDFRSLVKDLASVFKMRIELRQIGVRDEARMLGGLGACGRPICCGLFLEEFQPVSIKMAKEQNLSLNPTKISGVCGRLMCCLKYEQDHYEQTRKRMPRIGREVSTPDGTGTVTELNIVKETVRVRIVNGDSSEIKEYPLESISRPPENGNSRKADNNTAPLPEGSLMKEEESDIASEEEIRILMSEEEVIDDRSRFSEVKEQGSEKEAAEDKQSRRRLKDKGQARSNHQLGQPVRRENPNKQRSESQKNGPDNSGTENPKTQVVKKDNWAEALKKAMDAMN